MTPALVGTTDPRYFGFVIGGALDAPTAADILTTGWDQPAFSASTSPAAAVVEDVTGSWWKELLGFPALMSFGFVTGAQGANTVGLAAARHAVSAGPGGTWNCTVCTVRHECGLLRTVNDTPLSIVRFACSVSVPQRWNRLPPTTRAASMSWNLTRCSLPIRVRLRSSVSGPAT